METSKLLTEDRTEFLIGFAEKENDKNTDIILVHGHIQLVGIEIVSLENGTAGDEGGIQTN